MAMQIVGLKDLRENMESYISRVRKGVSFTVVRRSKAVFHITPVDAWGDDGSWETVADLTSLNKKGIVASKVVASLKRLNAKAR